MFKITQRLNNPKYSWYERGEAKIKYSIYSVMHELLQCQIAFPMFFNLLLVVESFQFLWYAIHPDYNFLWTTTFSNYPRDIIKFFQFDGLLREGDQNTYFAILYICFAVQLFILICLIIVLILLERAKKKSISIVFYTLRMLSFYVLLLITIAPIPLTDIFMVAIICKNGDPIRGSTACYSGVNLINMGVGIFGLITTVVFSFFSQLLFIDLNPSSNIPFAAPRSSAQLAKLFLKFALPIYIVLDSNPDATKDLAHANVFVGIFCIAYLLVLVLRYNSQGYYNSGITLFAVVLESWIFWSTIVATIHAFLDNENVDDTGLYYFLFVSPFASMTYFKIFTHQKKGILQSNIRKFTKGIEFEKYLNLIMHLVDNIEFEGNRIALEGVLRYHVRFCKNEFGTCPCAHMASTIPKEDEEVAEIKKSWYEFIRSIIGDAMATFNKNARLHLQHAYFQQEKLHNRYKALFELSITEEHRPSIQEEFSVFRYRNIIEKEMIEDDIRNTDIRGLDVNLIVHFQGKLVALQGEIGKAVNMQLDFWRELQQTNPNVQKLLHLGSRITIQGDIVKTSYTKLSELNSSHIRMLKLYGNFLKDILHDKFEATRVLENAEYAERSVKNFMDNERMKYSENSKTCIITCSGNLHSMGKILSANNESMDVLQYVHTEIIGQSINTIMPNVIADIHDDLMKRYFETNEAKVMGRERLIFPMTRAGYIVPCNLMIKIFPNLDEGIRVVGFLRKIDSKSSEEASHRTHYVIYGGEENDIYGVSENCFESFGIPASLTTGETKDFTITSILPDLMNQNMEELKSTTGLVCTIDTTTLEQNFLIDRQDSEVNEEDDETKQRRYRSSKVRVVLLSEDLYLGKHSVKILKFVEQGDAETKVTKGDIISNEEQNQKKEAAGEGGSQETDMDVSRSEGSSVSVGSSIGEDSRQLKDMKAKITEKNVPSSISALQRYSLAFIIGLIIIAGVQLGKRSSMHDDLWYGLTGTRLAYDRYTLMPATSFQLRVLDLTAEGIFDATLYEASIRAGITTKILDLTQMQFDLSQVTSYISQTIGDSTAVSSVIRNELLDGSIATSTMDLDQALYEYISSAQILNELPLSDYNQPIGTDSAEIPFYYIQRNGLNALRTGVKAKADIIYQDYTDRIDYYRRIAIITMAVAIAFIGIAQSVMLPKIFSVNKTNTKVLALFGYIPPEEVGELAEKCERFMVTFLDEISAKREESYYESERDDEDLERSQQLDNGSKGLKRRPSNNIMESQEDSLQQNYTVQMKEFSYKEDVPHMRVKKTASQLMIPDQESAVQITNKSMDEDKSFGTPLNKKTDQMEKSKDAEDIPMDNNNGRPPKEKKEEEEEDEELLEFLQERSKKLKASKDNNRGMVVIQLMAICFGIIAYFLADFFHERNFLIRFGQGLDHLQVISQRSPNMKYVLLFSTEEVAEDNLTVVYPDISSSVVATDNYRIQYSNLIYSNQAQIKQTFQETFPNDFSNYLTTLLDYNNNDICSLYYSNNATYYSMCVAAGGQQGLIQTEVAFVENLEAAITSFYNTANRDDSTKITVFNSAAFNTAYNIYNIVDSIYSYLIDDFLSAFQSYFSQMFILQKVKFLVFFFCILCGFVIIWLPYLGRLQRQIFRTKGLLNMIPMDMLKKNKSLRETFTSNEILKAVQ